MHLFVYLRVCLLSSVQSSPHFAGLSENMRPISVLLPLRAGQGSANSHNYMSQDDIMMAGVTEMLRAVELILFFGLKV